MLVDTVPGQIAVAAKNFNQNDYDQIDSKITKKFENCTWKIEIFFIRDTTIYLFIRDKLLITIFMIIFRKNFLDDEDMQLGSEPVKTLETDSEDDLIEMARRLSARPN